MVARETSGKGGIRDTRFGILDSGFKARISYLASRTSSRAFFAFFVLADFSAFLLGRETPLRPNRLLLLLRLGTKGFVQVYKVWAHKSTRDGMFYRGSKAAHLIG